MSEKQAVLKKAFKPKSVLLKSANLSENKQKISEENEDDSFSKLDPEIFTMEMETETDHSAENPTENRAENQAENQAENPVENQAENEKKFGQKDTTKKLKKKKAEGSETKDGEPKAKKKKSEKKAENDKKSDTTEKVRKAPKKKAEISQVTVESEDGILTIKIEKEDEKPTQQESSESPCDIAEGNISTTSATNEDGQKEEAKKQSKLPKEKGNAAKSNQTQSKKTTEEDGPKKKKFSAPVSKPKKGFQAPVVTKKESKTESKSESKKVTGSLSCEKDKRALSKTKVESTVVKTDEMKNPEAKRAVKNGEKAPTTGKDFSQDETTGK